tara:strand:+ start:3243 stop:3455 length:213 start_codon:yes stop_codon:yes gene_type:complete
MQQKYQINDLVNKKQNNGLAVRTGSIAGTIIEVQKKLNKIGRTCFYYKVKWPDTRTSIHAQHILVPTVQN